MWIVGCLTHMHEQERGRQMIYLKAFLKFLQVGMFSFGGGYAAMPLIQGRRL